MANMLQILEKARELLSNPKSWMQKVLWADEQGNAVEIDKACRFCLDGAIEKVHFDIEGKIGSMGFDHAVIRALGFTRLRDLYDWNDDPERTHQEVLDRLDQAIAKLK